MRTGSIADEVAGRVRAAVAAAEAEAEAIRAAARHDADRLVTERRERLAAASDELLERTDRLLAGLRDAEALRQEVDALVRTLAAAAARIARDAEPADARAPRAAHDTAPRPVPPAAGGPLDGARLVAAEMAAAGRPRAAIAAELRGTFGVDDPDAIVADVLAERAAGRLGA